MEQSLTTQQPTALPTTTKQPTLPSAKPPRSLAIALLTASSLIALAGLGLATSATRIYMIRADRRLEQSDTITAIERRAELRQQQAQSERGYAAPVWISGQTFDPTVIYQVSGTRQTEVPVIVGLELDEAVCIGTMGPDGFTQNRDNPLCLGY